MSPRDVGFWSAVVYRSKFAHEPVGGLGWKKHVSSAVSEPGSDGEVVGSSHGLLLKPLLLIKL